MTYHTELLNYIARKIGARTYLEIGIYNPDHNFNKIEVPYKIGVDPDHAVKKPDAPGILFRDTSDRFFDFARAMEMQFDMGWIDGLHYAEQVQKDMIGVWDLLRPGGVMAIHDCNPPTEKTTCIPRGTQREWCGTVYQTICLVRHPVQGENNFTVDMDYGCAVMRKVDSLIDFLPPAPTWEQFDGAREFYLNLTSVEDSLKIIDSWISFT